MTFGAREGGAGGASGGGPSGVGEPRSGRDLALVLISVAGLAGCLTLVFLAMRAVMDIGGACADGGPFVPVQPCPDGVPLLLVLGIFGLFGFGGLGFYAGARIGGGWAALPLLAWPGLFLSLGWNFLEYGFWPPVGVEWEWGWLIPGVLFVLMGGGPLLFAVAARREFDDRGGTAAMASTFGLGSLGGGRVRISYAGADGSGESRTTARGSGTAPADDIVERLERLARLRQSGDLTDAEYEAAKAGVIAAAGGGGAT